MAKVALVTGGSRGIGRAICVKLASLGYQVVTNYNNSPDAFEETKDLAKAAASEAGVEVLEIKGMKADISNSEDCEKLIAFALESGSLDVLVNNAGITKDGLTARMSDEDFQAVIDVNLNGTFYMMRAASKVMLKAKHGHIVNISSVVGIMGNAGQINYAASKAGVIGMTKSLAKELASRHITVNAVAPGMIETDMTNVLSDAAKEKIYASIPFKSMGKPEDIANAVAFLAGEESSYITGQVISVDGGMNI